METHRDDVPKRAFTGLCCSLHPNALTRKATETAIERVDRALGEGRLLSPSEALALAGKTAREETLFSIARAVAWETGADQDEILCRLGEKFSDFA